MYKRSEGMPEIVQYWYPVALAIGNLIQLILHLRSKSVIDIARKMFGEETDNDTADVGRLESFLIQYRVFTSL